MNSINNTETTQQSLTTGTANTDSENGNNQNRTADTTTVNTTTPSTNPSDRTSPSEIYTTGTPITTVYPGDLLYFPRKQIHALVRTTGDYTAEITIPETPPERIDLLWIDGYDRAFRTRNLHRSTIERMASNNRVRLVAEDLNNIDDINRAPGVRHPDRYTRDTTVQPGSRLPVSNLTFNRIYSLKRANGFLKHPVIDHKHGRVQKAKAIFTATRPDNRIAAVTTVNSVNARMAFDRETVEITRYASHPETPPHQRTNNTATWMLSRICQWAALEGYETIRTYAGTDGNNGQIYEAAGFTYTGTANSSGQYNREGRQNQKHAATLRRYVCPVSVDGENAVTTVPRRVESRLESNTDAAGQSTTLSTFTQSTTKRSPANFQFTREDVTDYKFARSTNADQYPAFSDALHQLVTTTDAPISLSELTDTRRNNLPAATFGAVVDGELVAALLVNGDVTDRVSEATVSGYAARDTAFPEATARWLLTRARDWSLLSGFNTVLVPRNTFDHVTQVNDTVPKSVGFTATTPSMYQYAACDSSLV